MNQLDLSIIIVNYNTKDLLETCLKSISQNTHNILYEIVVVDNHSKDSSVQMIEGEFPDARLIKNKSNNGYSKANNQGINISQGRYILLLNSDTEVSNDALNKAVKFMDDNSEIGICGLKLLNADGSIQLSCRSFPTFSTAIFNRYSIITRLFPDNKFSREYLLSDWDHKSIMDVDWVSGACMLIRREVIDKIGLLEEKFFMYSEDVDLCYRAKENGWRIVYYPLSEVIHYIGKSSEKKPFLSIFERHKSMYLYYKKHYSREILFLDLITLLAIMFRALFQSISYYLKKS